jgi:hypothetical protein
VTDPFALIGVWPDLVCYEHGVNAFEDHHLFGRANSPSIVKLPGNLHRVLSDLQTDWPPGVRDNPTGDPLTVQVAMLLGLLDLLFGLLVFAATAGFSTSNQTSAGGRS